MILLYSAGRQLAMVRAVLSGLLAVGALACWWGFTLARSYGLAPADGSVLAPLPERLAVGGLVAALGLAAAAGMVAYVRCYAARILLDPARGRLHVHLAAPWSDALVVDVGAVGERRYHEGRLALRSIVHAPWLTVRVPGRRLPLVVDAQGTVHDRRLMRRHLGWSGEGAVARGPSSA